MPDNPALRSVPPDGSLGHLAYGYRGLVAWRAARGTDWLDAEREHVEAAEAQKRRDPGTLPIPDLSGVDLVVVSGLPRSGTSMLMQMLDAAGLPPFVDGQRGADESNPRGYYEHARIKTLARDKRWLPEAHGHVAKVVAPLLPHLPPGPSYHVLLLTRSLDEILRSQSRMLDRQGRPVVADGDLLRTAYTRQLSAARRWAGETDNAALLEIDHADVIASPLDAARQIAAFLGADLDIDVMAATVDPSLHRERA